MPKTSDTLYQCYEEFRQGLKWKEGTTEDEIWRALTVLQEFVKFLVDKEWKSGVSTRRDQFAMAALGGLLANEGAETKGNEMIVGKACYDYADAMIEAAEK